VTAWQAVEVRDGEKGPLAVQVARTLVQARGEGRVSDVVEWLVVCREQQGDGSWKHDYLLSNAAITTPPEEFARVFKAQHRIEESLKRAKGEAGLADYQVRTWEGWHHHMALTLIAVWFLIGETHRGQQWTPALTLPQVRYGLSVLLMEMFCTPGIDSICRHVHRQLMRNELARFYHHRTRTCMPPRKLRRDIQ
jgi:hypothetical protein